MSDGTKAPTDGGVAQINLRPWAAYAVGRNLWNIEVISEELSSYLLFYDAEEAKKELVRLFADISDLDEAIGILAHFSRVDAEALHRFHLAIRDFLLTWHVKIDRATSQYESFESRVRDSEPPSLRGLAWTSRSLLTEAEEDLLSWYQAGEAIGRHLYFHRPGHHHLEGMNRMDVNIGELLEWASTRTNLPSIIDALDSVRRAYARRIPNQKRISFRKAYDYVKSKWIDIFQLDARIIHALRNELPVEPILILEGENPTLFGLPIPVEQNRKQILCLWVLANNLEQFVDRDIIVNEIGTAYESEGLPIVVSRLRRLLKKLIAKHRHAAGGVPLENERLAYIVGLRGKTTAPGPYKLALDPLLVRVAPELPDWW